MSPVESKEERTMIKVECAKCGGKGHIPHYSNIAGGVCFSCQGRGYNLQKSEPKRSKTYTFFFCWEDPSATNYNGGDFCRCYNKKFRSFAAAERHAAQAMERNGSQDFWIEEVA